MTTPLDVAEERAGQGVLPWRRGELAAMLTAFAAFASILCGYYLLRPIRDAWAITRGTSDLRYFFLYTFVAMLVVLPIYWWLVKRYSRRGFLTATFVGISLATLIFAVALHARPDSVFAAGAFFVFLSVVNLFLVSVFWSVMADVFASSQAPRLFGIIAGGGSAGAIVGPALATTLVHDLRPEALLALASALFLIALALIRRMLRNAATPRVGRGREHVVVGTAMDDLVTLVRSRYVLAIVLMLVTSQIAANLVYNEQARAVSAAYHSLADRTGFFANIDLWVNGSAFVLQVLVGHSLVRRFGFRSSLTLMPVLAALSFLGLGLMPTLTMLIATQVVRRAGEYGLFRPARETLFTVVGDSVKYRSKSLTDTVIHRGGDALGAFLHRALTQAGLTLPAIAFVCAGLCGLIVGLAAWLGGQFQARASGVRVEPDRVAGDFRR